MFIGVVFKLTLLFFLFQFNPSMPEIFALASYNKSSACYLDPRAQLLCVLEGQKGWESVQDLNFWWYIQNKLFSSINQ